MLKPNKELRDALETMNRPLTRTQARAQTKSLTRQFGVSHVVKKCSYVPTEAFLRDEDFGESKRVHGYTVVIAKKRISEA